MRRPLSLLLVFSFIFLLFGCQSASKHYIEENGSYYLVIDNLPAKTPVDSSGYGEEPVALIRFSSVDEMRKRIQSASFSEDELTEIARFDRDSQGRVLMFDLASIYVPYHPSAITRYDVCWFGDYYRYDIYSDICKILSIQYETRAQIDTIYNSYAPENGYHDTGKKLTKTRSFSESGSTYRVIETYAYSVSKEYPNQIRVFVERDNQYFMVHLSDLQGPVTDEFLTQFEYRLYTD